MHSCPLCQRYFSALNKHLKNMHLIHNAEERRLLLNMASGRVNIRAAPCPVPGCQNQLSRLDRHINQSHAELTIAERAAKMNQAKRIRTMELLAELRATDPTPAMQSMLDVNPNPLEEEIDVAPPSPVADCGSAECRRIRLGYERELEGVKAERDEFCAEVRLLRTKLQKQLRSMKSGRTTAVESQEDERMTEGGRSSAASEEAGRSSAASEKAGPSSAASEKAGRSSAASEKAGPSSAAWEEEAGSSSFSPWSSGSGMGNLMRRQKLIRPRESAQWNSWPSSGLQIRPPRCSLCWTSTRVPWRRK
ncbi:uncharacterized protein LOC124849807 [Scophthalmus maximus]|uniref:uncharacterized protein LOC124849807 n=1 Tax=Scophthalmus maximus TaxID=52904 RepID=UPI001FA82F77|nr:uncharacterized protein LOC124849807 [Scophthalmus maximus]